MCIDKEKSYFIVARQQYIFIKTIEYINIFSPHSWKKNKCRLIKVFLSFSNSQKIYKIHAGKTNTSSTTGNKTRQAKLYIAVCKYFPSDKEKKWQRQG